MTIKFNEDEQEKKLKELRNKEEESLASMLSEKYKVPYIELAGIPIDTDGLKLIEEKVARASEVAAFNLVGKKVSLAMRSPQKESSLNVIKTLEEEGYVVKKFIASLFSLEKAWSRYKDITFASESSSGLLDVSSKDIEEFIKNNHTPDKVREMIKEVLAMKKSHRVSRIVETILAGAISLGASDIHVEPQETSVAVRMRLDGILVNIADFDLETYKLLLSRVKLLSGLKLNITKNAQDGRFSIHIAETEIEIRSSVLPGNYGESIVLRVLNPETIALSLHELGMHESILKVVKKELDKPSGMILNTGPTGSGKTTALYAFLKYLSKPGIKIITIEDPIEYHLPGVTQTQVDKSKDYTFLSGLRSALRQDPDVIMIGEIRDRETAEVAINAALTGHLVLSTLHTNNAAGTFPRLIDLGINPNTLGSALHLTMAQRLVRKLIPECKEEFSLNEEDKLIAKESIEKIKAKGIIPGAVDTTKAWRVKEECKSRDDGGYKGRLGVFEGIVVDNELEEFLKNSPGEREIVKFAETKSIMDIKEDGVLKILQGTTDFSELRRVIDIDS